MVEPQSKAAEKGDSTASNNANTITGSSSSAAAPSTNGNGNNSDNSNYSLGNNSFGFNFDSEEGMSNPSPPNSDIGGNEQVANTSAATTVKVEPSDDSSAASPSNQQHRKDKSQQQEQKQQQEQQLQGHQNQQQQAAPSSPQPSSKEKQDHMSAAAQAVSKLHSIASQSVANVGEPTDDNNCSNKETNDAKGLKRKFSSMSASNGYNSDDERSNTNSPETGIVDDQIEGRNQTAATATASQQQKNNIAQHELLQQQQTQTQLQNFSLPNNTTSTQVSSGVTTNTESIELTTSNCSKPTSANDDANAAVGSKKKKLVDDVKREERNAREKERSYRIAAQINELRTLLSNGGVIVPKGTKNAVLTEAANYIKMLQQHQFKSEIHRQQLIQQMQMIGSGAIGPQASNAIRHVAAQNGVWSLGNFGGLPPITAASGVDPTMSEQQNLNQAQQENQSLFMKSINENDYRCIFNSCAIPMAIASMGGAFIDCNELFIQLSQYTKQEICSLTIFNLTARSDLQHAFDLVSQMISPPTNNNDIDPPQQSPSCVLRGNMKSSNALGLNITLIRDDDGVAKCFCVSLIKNPASPFDTSAPVHATASLLLQQQQQQQLHQDANKQGLNLPSPTFMSG